MSPAPAARCWNRRVPVDRRASLPRPTARPIPPLPKHRAEPTPDARSAACERLDAVLRELRDPDLGDSGIHRARKELKRARALLRLLRTGLGRTAFRRENRALRDVARTLSGPRDAQVLAAALADLLARTGVPARAAGSLAASLAQEHRQALAEFRRDRHAREAAARSIRTVRRRLARAPCDGRRWTTVGQGFERIYARGRSAAAHARDVPTSENLHDWRKQVKNYWHALELLEPAWPRVLGAHAREAHRLADALGDDHDLALLAERLRNVDLAPTTVRELLAGLEARRTKLQARAVALGARLYREPPKRVRRRVGEWYRRPAEERRAPRPRRLKRAD